MLLLARVQSPGPYQMVAIDHEVVPMPAARMVMGMTMGLRPLPALMFVLVVFVVVVQVGMLNGVMVMLERDRVP